MTLYLHIGAQKTGSTTIQRALYENKRALRATGLRYPEVNPEDPNKVSHYNSFRGITSRNKKDIKATERFLNRINTIDDDILLSSEVLSNYPTIMSNETPEQYWQRKTHLLHDLKSRFRQQDIKVIYCIRDRESYLKSLFKQHLKVNKHPYPSLEAALETFLRHETIRSDTKAQTQIWSEVFNDVHTIPFEDHAENGTLLEAFVAALDRDLILPQQAMANVSPDWTTLEIRRQRLASHQKPSLRWSRDEFNTHMEDVVNGAIKSAIASAGI